MSVPATLDTLDYVTMSLMVILSTVTAFYHAFSAKKWPIPKIFWYLYLEYRFSRTIRLVASIVNTTQMVLYTSCVIYAPAMALNQVTGLHLWGSVIAIGIICVIYTSLSGIKAVIWADVIQLVVIFCAILVVLIKGSIDVGGIQKIWNTALQGQRLNV